MQVFILSAKYKYADIPLFSSCLPSEFDHTALFLWAFFKCILVLALSHCFFQTYVELRSNNNGNGIYRVTGLELLGKALFAWSQRYEALAHQKIYWGLQISLSAFMYVNQEGILIQERSVYAQHSVLITPGPPVLTLTHSCYSVSGGIGSLGAAGSFLCWDWCFHPQEWTHLEQTALTLKEEWIKTEALYANA